MRSRIQSLQLVGWDANPGAALGAYMIDEKEEADVLVVANVIAMVHMEGVNVDPITTEGHPG